MQSKVVCYEINIVLSDSWGQFDNVTKHVGSILVLHRADNQPFIEKTVPNPTGF